MIFFFLKITDYFYSTKHYEKRKHSRAFMQPRSAPRPGGPVRPTWGGAGRRPRGGEHCLRGWFREARSPRHSRGAGTLVLQAPGGRGLWGGDVFFVKRCFKFLLLSLVKWQRLTLSIRLAAVRVLRGREQRPDGPGAAEPARDAVHADPPFFLASHRTRSEGGRGRRGVRLPAALGFLSSALVMSLVRGPLGF